MSPPTHPQPPANFLKLAYIFEGGLIGVAYLIGWAVDIDPFANFSFDGNAIFWGTIGTVPLFLLFMFFYKYPLGPFYPIKRSLNDIMGPLLAQASPLQMLLLAALAGLSEELLFRGVLQPWLEIKWGMTLGLIFSNVIFGFLHWVTPMYALIAGTVGVYLGIMLDSGGERNLLTPIFIHGAYDYLAFLVVARNFVEEQKNQ